jgi:uncharacterized protein YjbI with pentapeptide repeats
MRGEIERRPNLTEWLGFRRNPDLARARWLGPILGVLLSIFAGAFLVATVATLVDFLQAVFRIAPYESDASGEAIRNIGIVIAGLLGVPFIIWRSIVAAQQVRIADEALLNDKIGAAAQNLSARREITRAVLQDGKENILKEWEDDLVGRAAAIDRLEGLVAEYNQIAPRIARLLATYVRGNFPCANLNITEPPFTRKTPRMDLQKAIDSIGRIYGVAANVDRSPWRLDLKGCDLDGVSFLNGYFRAADFSGSRLEASKCALGDFEGCLFGGALLNFGDFRNSNLTGARFDRAIINRPIPIPGGFVSSINLGDLTGATFIGSDISALDYLGDPSTISKTFGTRDTRLSAIVREKMLNADDHSRAHTVRQVRHRQNLDADDLKRIEGLEQTGFQHWSPFDSDDLATSWLLETFYNELGMNRWPYVG